MTEEALRQSLILSGGTLIFFVTRPIAAGFLILTIFLFLLPAIRPLAQRVGRAFKVEEVEKAGGD
jgi:TctA family transporter